MQLLGRIEAVLIEKAVFLFPGFGQFHRLIIRQAPEDAAIKHPFPVLCRQFFDELGHDERPLPHVVDFPVCLRAQACITAIDEFGMAEFLEDGLFQRLKGLLLVLVSREEEESEWSPVPVREHPPSVR